MRDEQYALVAAVLVLTSIVAPWGVIGVVERNTNISENAVSTLEITAGLLNFVTACTALSCCVVAANWNRNAEGQDNAVDDNALTLSLSMV